MKKQSRIALHIYFWLAYLVFESYIEYAWIGSSYPSVPVSERLRMATAAELVLLTIKLPLTYFIFWLFNQFTAKRINTLVLILTLVLLFAITTFLHRLLVIKIILPHFYHEEASNKLLFVTQRIISSFLDLLFVAGMAFAMKQYRLNRQSKEHEKTLVQEKLAAELKFLRTQTNPHFLFNTLNNIYALARKKSDETPGVVMKLSKLLRFMLYESRNNTITIAEELKILEDYIELEKIRYNDRLTITFNRSIDDETQPIAPLILLPFVENAFKHGASESRFNTTIRIDVKLEKGQFNFIIQNSKDDEGENNIRENIGLSNVRRQLELMYPEHSLQLNNDKNIFTVSLTINLYNHAAISMPDR